MIIFSYITQCGNMYLRKKFLFDKLFDVRFDAIGPEINKAKRIQRGELLSSKRDIIEMEIDNSSSADKIILPNNKIKKMKIELERDKPRNSSYNFQFFLKSMFGNLKKNRTEYEDAYCFMDLYTRDNRDIVKFLRLFDIVEILRWILLNKEENMLLDYRKIPNLADQNEIDILSRYTSEEDLNRLITFYKDKAKRKNLNEKEKKLLMVVDPCLKSLIFN